MGGPCGSCRVSLKEVVVCLCACCNNVCIFVFAFGLNTLFGDLQASFHTDRASTASVQAVCLGLTTGGGLVAGMVARKLGHRMSLLLGSLLSSGGYLAGGFADSLPVLIVCVGVVSGSGYALLNLSNMACALQRFSSRAGVVSSAMMMASGLVMVVSPFLFRHLAETYSWRGCLIMVSALTFHSSIFSLLLTSPLLQPPPPSSGAAPRPPGITQPLTSPDHSARAEATCLDGDDAGEHSSPDLDLTSQSGQSGDGVARIRIQDDLDLTLDSEHVPDNVAMDGTSPRLTTEPLLAGTSLKVSAANTGDVTSHVIQRNTGIDTIIDDVTSHVIQGNTDMDTTIDDVTSHVIQGNTAMDTTIDDVTSHVIQGNTAMDTTIDDVTSHVIQGNTATDTTIADDVLVWRSPRELSASHADSPRRRPESENADQPHHGETPDNKDASSRESCRDPIDAILSGLEENSLKHGRRNDSHHPQEEEVEEEEEEEGTDVATSPIVEQHPDTPTIRGREKNCLLQARFFTDPLFIAIVLCSMLTVALSTSFVLLVLDFAQHQGWQLRDGLLLNLVFMVFNLVSRVGAMVLSLHRKVRSVALLATGGLLGGAAGCLIDQVSSYQLVACLYACLGTAFGLTVSMYGPAVLEATGGHEFNLALGLCLTCVGVSISTCTGLAGFLVDTFGSYSLVSLVYGVSVLSASAVLLLVFLCGRKT
ncbi:uncharacterized protein LOC143290808 [Babylonia areolata]|uniref:uncharacterized protein LOC143290808 n=1 Tax=Babylonia areolata TaxID=304850 RepID=UPI003FCEF6BC